MALLVVLTSCSKKLDVNWDYTDATSLQVKEIDFEFFQAKAKINFQDQEYDVKAKATIRIKKDSLMWFNFTAVGISGGRCLINRDSLTLMNMIKKEYYIFDYEDLSKKFNYPITYDVIQSVILGNMTEKIEKGDKVERNEQYYRVLQPNGQFLLDSRVNSKTMKLESVNITERNSNNNATVQYSDFNLVEDHAFAYRALVNLLYESDLGKFITNVDLEYTKAEILDKELKFPFNIPSKYERKEQ